MSPKSNEEKLSGLSYLWTSGDWKLHCCHRSLVRIIVVFPKGRPSPQELLAVRALVPRFADSPLSILKAEVGALSQFVVGEFTDAEASCLQSKASARGLQARAEDASFTSYLPVSVHGSALIIEDNELASLVQEEMRRRGVPVVSVDEME